MRSDVPQAAPPLVGRAPEMDVLRDAVARVAGGGSGAVLLTGVPGVGKTRLAREALAVARDAGFAAFTGHAHALARDIAYAPVVEAFTAALHDLEPARRKELTGDLPQLGLLFSGLGLTVPAPLRDPALERTRLMDAVARMVERLARQRPLALLIDDLPSADPATVQLLAYLAASATGGSFLLLVTAVSDADGADRLAALSGGLTGAAWWVRPLDVGPLPADPCRALLVGLLGGPVAADLERHVWERCAGRPLFVEAVARTLAESGLLAERDGTLHLDGGKLPLPSGVRAQLMARLSTATPDERAVLNLLAVNGGAAEHDVLAHAAALPDARLASVLDRLFHRGLLATDAGPGYDLAHGLLRDTLLADLSPVAIGQAHAGLVRALAACRPDDQRIAAHVRQAGPFIDPDVAWSHLVRGCAQARRIGAVAEAVRCLTAAVAIARRGHRADALAERLAELGELRQQLNERDGARDAWREAAERFRAAGDAIGVARIERELAMLAWSEGDLAAARAGLAAAQHALDGLEPCGEHAALLHALTVTAVRTGDAATVARTARQLRELAAGLGSPGAAAQADLAEAMLDCAGADYVGMADKSRRGLASALRGDRPELVIRAYDQLAVAAANQGDVAGLREHSAASLRVADELGSLVLTGWPRARLAVAELLSGDWDAALRSSTELMTLADRFGERRERASALGTHAWVLVLRGRLAEAGGCLDDAYRLTGPSLRADRNIFKVVANAAVALALAEDDPARACERGAPLDDLSGGWLTVLGAALLCEARVRAGDLDGARELAEHLRSAPRCATVLPATVHDWVNGLADAAGHDPRGVARLNDAAAGFHTLDLPFHEARARLAAASAEADRDTAVSSARAALREFERIGAPRQVRQARDLLRGLGVVPSRGRTRRAAGGALSDREFEVARLVAAGLSSADVATRLFISPRTVTTHLDRIYTRLGLSSRVALTRYLADSGLLDDPDRPAAR